MARIRYLKPDFFKDEDLADLSFEVRLIYAGLWCFADKEGRLEDRPKRLKAEIMPYNKIDMEKALQVLATPKANRKDPKPYIQRYEVSGNNYIQILEWHKHQKPHHTEKESQIPKPPIINIKGMEKGMGMGKINQLEASTELDNVSLTVKTKGFDFESLWNEYPKRLGKKEAMRHFRASVKTEGDYENIKKALRNYKAYIVEKKFEEQYIKQGSVWFNNWQDWIDYGGKEDSSSSKIKFKDKS